MNKDFSEPPERRRAFDERPAEERSCQLAGSFELLGSGSVPLPSWMHAHLTECLSCMNDFARLQSLNSHPAPGGRRGLGSSGLSAKGDHMLDVVQELGAFMLERKKFWLLPIVLIMVLFGGLLVVTQGSAIAPFIYTLW